ncbi:hypothetical protein BD413DRAFT_201102 [Trametes elegans]|nr:hypothetical protein BD413DRAFT_201102 [Trametes elegans]
MAPPYPPSLAHPSQRSQLVSTRLTIPLLSLPETAHNGTTRRTSPVAIPEQPPTRLSRASGHTDVCSPVPFGRTVRKRAAVACFHTPPPDRRTAESSNPVEHINPVLKTPGRVAVGALTVSSRSSFSSSRRYDSARREYPDIPARYPGPATPPRSQTTVLTVPYLQRGQARRLECRPQSARGPSPSDSDSSHLPPFSARRHSDLCSIIIIARPFFDECRHSRHRIIHSTLLSHSLVPPTSRRCSHCGRGPLLTSTANIISNTTRSVAYAVTCTLNCNPPPSEQTTAGTRASYGCGKKPCMLYTISTFRARV